MKIRDNEEKNLAKARLYWGKKGGNKTFSRRRFMLALLKKRLLGG